MSENTPKPPRKDWGAILAGSASILTSLATLYLGHLQSKISERQEDQRQSNELSLQRLKRDSEREIAALNANQRQQETLIESWNAERDRQNQQFLALQDQQIKRQATTDDDKLRSAQLFRDLLADLRDPIKAQGALLVLWRTYTNSSDREIIVPAALLSSEAVPENLRILKLLGPEAASIVKRAERSYDPRLAIQARRFLKIHGGSTITEADKISLEQIIRDFETYLARIGFSELDRNIHIFIPDGVDAPTSKRACYFDSDTSRLIVWRQFLSETNVILRPIAYSVLREHSTRPPDSEAEADYLGITLGLCTYLACDFAKDPTMPLHTWVNEEPHSINLANKRSILDISGFESDPYVKYPEIWGGLFWDIRSTLAQHGKEDSATKVICAAYRQFMALNPLKDVKVVFSQCLIDRCNAEQPQETEELKKVMKFKGLTR